MQTEPIQEDEPPLTPGQAKTGLFPLRIDGRPPTAYMRVGYRYYEKWFSYHVQRQR